MAGFFGLSDLQARKRALVIESEVYRQTLMLEVQQVQVRARAVRRRLATFGSPLFLLAPLIGPWLARARARVVQRVVFGKQPFGWRRLALGAWTAWRLYRQFSPIARNFLGARNLHVRVARQGQQAGDLP